MDGTRRATAAPVTGGRDPALIRALARWQHAAGPYWAYVCAAPFLGRLPNRRRYPAVQARHDLAESVAALAAAGGTAVFVDAPPTESLTAGPMLNDLGLFVVPTFERWAVSPALVPSDHLLQVLVMVGDKMARPRIASGVVVLLDGDRAGESGSSPGSRPFDNRYTYSSRPFPPPALLLRQGITGVRWRAPKGIAPDLESYAARLSAAGLSPVVV